MFRCLGIAMACKTQGVAEIYVILLLGIWLVFILMSLLNATLMTNERFDVMMKEGLNTCILCIC